LERKDRKRCEKREKCDGGCTGAFGRVDSKKERALEGVEEYVVNVLD